MPWAVAAAAVAAGGTIAASNKQSKAGKDASNAQASQNAADRDFMLQQSARARDDVTGLYPQMQENTMLGGQAALDVLRNSYGQQVGLRQAGTQNAIAALMGGQTAPMTADLSFLPQRLPQYKTYQAPTGSALDMLTGKMQASAAEKAAADSAAAAAKLKEQDSLSYRLDPKNAWSNPQRDVKKLIKKLF